MEFEFGIVGDELCLSDDDTLASYLPMRAVELESQRQYNTGACPSELICEFQGFLDDLAFELQPREADYLARLKILNNLSSAIANMENYQGARLSAFGSFESNFYSRWADLDLSLELSNKYAFEKISKREKVKILRSFMNNVIYRGPCRKVMLVPDARVPLVSFEDIQYNISCDVSVHNNVAVLKSRLLRWIGEIDSRCRDLIFLVKFWAKANHINDPKAGTLNSFALCLLAIFHLQTRSPPILPPLNALLDEDVARQLSDPRNCAGKILDDCRRKIQPFIIQEFGRQNKSTVAELFTSFFNQFSAVTELWRQGLAVCTFTGKWGDRASTCTEWRNKQFAMTVEDPFDRAENCARSVQRSSSNMIFNAFNSTADMLHNLWSDCDLPELLHAIFLWPLESQTLGLQPWLVQVHSKMGRYRVKRNPLEKTTVVKSASMSIYSKSRKQHLQNVRQERTKDLVPFMENSIEEKFSETKNKTRTEKTKVVPLIIEEGISAEAKSVMEYLIEEKFNACLQLDNNRDAPTELQKKTKRPKGNLLPLSNEDGNSPEVNSRLPAAIESGINEVSVFPPLVSTQKQGSEVEEKNLVTLKGKWCIQMPFHDGGLSPNPPGAPVNKKTASFPESSKGQLGSVTHRELKEVSYLAKTLTHSDFKEGSYLAKTLASLDGKTEQAGGPSINKQKKEGIVKSMSSSSTKTDKSGGKVIYKQKQRVVNLDHTNEQWRGRSSGVWRQRENLPNANDSVSDGILPRDHNTRKCIVAPRRPPSERW